MPQQLALPHQLLLLPSLSLGYAPAASLHHLLSIVYAMATVALRKQVPPFYAPRMIHEWKRRTDEIWTTKTGLAKWTYSTLMEGKTDLALCNEFLQLMRQRSEDKAFPTGMVGNVLVRYSSRYLHAFFGWDGTGATEWSPACVHPRPDVDTLVHHLPLRPDGRYDVFALRKVLVEPWFSRMRGIMSQVFFKNDCNGITPD